MHKNFKNTILPYVKQPKNCLFLLQKLTYANDNSKPILLTYHTVNCNKLDCLYNHFQQLKCADLHVSGGKKLSNSL